ncbi:MAG: stage II sporulation protein M [Candidatus Pacearchaeota archaeon]
MLETLLNPRKAERRPWEMILIGILYATISLFLVDFLFLKNFVFEKYVSMLIVCFTVIFSIPFFFYMIKNEEEKDTRIKSEKNLLKEHGRALAALCFLFIGYVIAFSVLFVVLPKDTTNANFKAQIETYCSINARYNVEQCIENAVSDKYLGRVVALKQTVNIKEGMNRISTILSNNFYVLLFSLLFSFLFGAGAIFILVWNASVIASAVGIFARGDLANLPWGLGRYMLHGLPEIASYFVVALAGGIIGSALIKHEFGRERFWHILQDSLDLVILALVVLIVSTFIEVFITPLLF